MSITTYESFGAPHYHTPASPSQRPPPPRGAPTYLIHAGAEDVVSLFVPLESEDGPLVLPQSRGQAAVRGPDARVAVVRSRGQQGTVTLPAGKATGQWDTEKRAGRTGGAQYSRNRGTWKPKSG